MENKMINEIDSDRDKNIELKCELKHKFGEKVYFD